MFTGLVRELGEVRAVGEDRGGARLRIAAELTSELAPGDSVSVSGVCLTATRIEKGEFAADVSPETLRRSALGDLAPGDRVNLEPALRAMDRLGGHVVQGHVDGVARVQSAEREGAGRRIRVEVPAELLRYVIEKGSVTLDGVSLTVAAIDERGFDVSLIPETVERTSLGTATPGRRVNLEVDVMAKYIEKLLHSAEGGGE